MNSRLAIANSSATKPKVRCAIYTRKSDDEGLNSEFNSLDAQRVYCQKYIETQEYDGWYMIPDHYEDGGISGYTTKRPALQRLLADVKSKLIDVVVVYKSDRLSRKMLDSLEILRMFEQNNVSFVSVTQKFDTSTPMGRLALHMMLSYEECERDTARERTMDKIAVSKKRGMWMGGYVPFGYESSNKKLVINLQEAETIKLIFNEFIKTRSLKKLALILRKREVKTKVYCSAKSGKVYGGNYFNTGLIAHILNNVIYTGKIKHKDAVYDGEHEAIITDEVWQAARTVGQIDAKVRGGISKRKIPFPLIGVLKCGGCNSSMTPSHTRKKGGQLYRYYVAKNHQKARCIDCPIKQVPAPEVESAVLTQLGQILQTPELLVNTWRSIDKPQVSENAVRESLSNIGTIWQELFPIEQERLLKLMLDKVIVHQDSLELKVRAEGLMSITQNANQTTQQAT